MDQFPPTEYLENILESLDQSIVVIDNQEKVVIWNSAMEELFFSKDDALGQRLSSLIPRFWEEYRGLIWGKIFVNEVLKQGCNRQSSRFPLQVKGKKIRYFDLKGTPLRTVEGNILGAILVMNDITDNLFLENQLLRQARTTSLANLGASIAHEIRNPLNSISLNIQLFKEWLLEPEEASQEEMIETLDNVLGEIHRLDELIRYFLRFSRPPDPLLEPQDPNVSVQQAITLLEEQARKSDVEIISCYNKLPKVALDRNQLSQAIYNLSLNAIQALKEQGGGKLEILTQDNNDYVIIEIKDNGLGLASEEKDKLFDLFFTTKEDGSGLGLPIANEIVERHNGKIVAENNLDRGACFTIYLPPITDA